jgi:UDP-N-acetyl-D-mannosaminuronate dehydrogenase
MLGMAYKKDIDELREGENKWTSTVREAQRHRRLRVKPAGGRWKFR